MEVGFMIMRTFVTIIVAAFAVPIAFGQGELNTQGREASGPLRAPHPSIVRNKTTTGPQGVKGYLDQQMANSKDKKFHVALNGKDLALTPIKIHEEKRTSANKSTAAADMKGADGKVYEIDFVLSSGQVTGASIGKVNGKSPSDQ
jgi:hypothetical protein